MLPSDGGWCSWVAESPGSWETDQSVGAASVEGPTLPTSLWCVCGGAVLHPWELEFHKWPRDSAGQSSAGEPLHTSWRLNSTSSWCSGSTVSGHRGVLCPPGNNDHVQQEKLMENQTEADKTASYRGSSFQITVVPR